jgi:ADP-ribose pyrophosphatase YjhB (NUDIX family)
MKEKVYVVFYSKDSVSILVGSGGRSGPKDRVGWHLPGGTVDGGKPVRSEAKREVREEFGTSRALQLSKEAAVEDTHLLEVEFPQDHTKVYFYFVEIVEETFKKMRGAIGDGKGTEKDTPFTFCDTVPVKAALAHFKDDALKDWFHYALARLDRHFSDTGSVSITSAATTNPEASRKTENYASAAASSPR